MSAPARNPNVPAPWKQPEPLPERFFSERLVLRRWREDDAERFFEAVNVDRGSLLPWMTWARDDNRTVEECRASIVKFNAKAAPSPESPGDFVIGLFDRSTGVAVGGTGLHRINAAAHEGEIGYWIRADRRRQGLCSEALRSIITWGFTPQAEGGWGLRRLHVRCAAGNLGSRGVPRKLGLREEARLVQERYVEGCGWEDTLVWGVLRDEWDPAVRSLRRR